MSKHDTPALFQKTQGFVYMADNTNLQAAKNLKDDELPRYIMVSDFQTFELYDLETGEENKFTLQELYQILL